MTGLICVPGQVDPLPVHQFKLNPTTNVSTVYLQMHRFKRCNVSMDLTAEST
jgi:hypothetical protein